MCDRLSCTLPVSEFSKACAYPAEQIGPYAYIHAEPRCMTSSYTFEPQYNLSPTSIVPIFAARSVLPKEDNISASKYGIFGMRWGMSPEEGSTISPFPHTVFYKEVMDSEVFKPELLENHRCVVLADGFYGWQNTSGEKQPYYIFQDREIAHRKNVVDWVGKPILKMAAVFKKVETDGPATYVCSIITTRTDKRLAWLQDRMPVMLGSFEEVENWVDCEKFNCDQSFEFLQNFARAKIPKDPNKNEYVLEYYSVHKKYVNDPTCQSKQCIERIYIKTQAALDNYLLRKSASGFPSTSK